MPKTTFLLPVDKLILLELTGESSYGYALAKRIAAKLNRPVHLGTIYPALERLERDGLVFSSQPPPRQGVKRSGRPVKHYFLAPPGLEEARSVAATLRRLLVSVKTTA